MAAIESKSSVPRPERWKTLSNGMKIKSGPHESTGNAIFSVEKGKLIHLQSKSKSEVAVLRKDESENTIEIITLQRCRSSNRFLSHFEREQEKARQ